MPGMQLLVLFTLRDGQSREDYEAWARGTDLPTVRRLGSIDAFRVFRMAGLFGSSDKPPYDYAELIEVADADAFMADIAVDPMPAIAAQFGTFADTVFIQLDELEPTA